MKTHACTWQGCGKTFTRAEHLRRHALNHEQERNNYTCQRCSVHFNRPDLLARHMVRHAKRDEEAGGPGLGVLETRKRTRRAPDGSIVTRPTKKQSRMNSGSAMASIAQMSSSSSCDSEDHPQGAPVSPPRSAHDSGSSVSFESHQHRQDGRPGIAMDGMDPLLAPMMPGGPYEPFVEPIPGQFDAADGSWGGPSGGLGLDMMGDFFTMDTATDFNMPFAATHNYNWLFDVSFLDDAFHHFDLPLGSDMANFAGDSFMGIDPDTWPRPDEQRHVDDGAADGMERLQHPDPTMVESTAQSTFPDETTKPSPEASKNIFASDGDMDWMAGFPMMDMDLETRLPRLTEEARQGILAVVSQAQPMGINGSSIDLESSLLSLPALQSYCDLFFTRFNVAYPLIHQATFDPNGVDKVFLAAILSLGATYSTREAHQLAVGMHDSLRNHLFCHADFSPQPDLWVLQAMLLIDCFGKMRAGHKQRDRAQLFHCVLIKLIRRSDCCSIRTPAVRERPGDMECAWRHAMQLEQRKRLAMHCFMWDTQHAVLFSQSLCMSAFEMRSSLPCRATAWEASSAEEWYLHASQEQDHVFLHVLKAYIAPSAVRRPRHLNTLARVFLLHGLMSVSSDLKRRDQTTLRSETPELVGAWKPRMGRSYDLWKLDFDADCMAMKLDRTADPRRFTGIKTAAHALYRAAHVTLNVEVLDLQIYAGAPQILGRVVTSADVERSQRNVPRWLHEDSRAAATAARHASYILQDAIMTLNEWDDADVFHFPWCLYLATLTCWTFHQSASSTHISDENGPTQSTAQAKNEMSSLIVAMTTCNTLDDLSALAGKYETGGLVKIMAKQLATVRWAVVHDAMKVLVNLSG